MEEARTPTGVDLTVFVAAVTAAAGVLHLALAPGRGGDHLALGLVFGAIGAVQLGGAALALRPPSRRVWPLLALGSTVLVGLWLAGHLVGVPFGPRAGEPEDVHAADAAIVAFEALGALGAAVVHLRPAAVRAASSRGATVRTSTAMVALVALCAAAVLAAPGALDAPGGSADGDASPGVPPPSTRGPRTEGLDDMPGATLVLPGTPTTFPAPGAPGAGTGGTPSSPTTTAAGDDGFPALLAGRREVPDEPIDRATRARLVEQLAATTALAATYPTLGAAEAAGYRRAGPFSPGSGTPYAPPRPPGNTDGRMDPDDLTSAVLLFDGTAPSSRLAGFLYLSTRAQTDGAPEGFAGPNDRWTFVTNVCTVPRSDARLVDTPLGIVRSVSAASCATAGGSLLIGAYYALHVWSVPGYESGAGTFRDVNASIVCPDGTYRTKAIDELGASGTLCRG